MLIKELIEDLSDYCNSASHVLNFAPATLEFLNKMSRERRRKILSFCKNLPLLKEFCGITYDDNARGFPHYLIFKRNIRNVR